MTTTGDDVPVVTPQASAASMSAPAVPVVPFTDCPVFRSPHCKLNDVSLGTATVDARAVEALASTNATATAMPDNLCATGDIGLFLLRSGLRSRNVRPLPPDLSTRGVQRLRHPRRTFLTPDAHGLTPSSRAGPPDSFRAK